MAKSRPKPSTTCRAELGSLPPRTLSNLRGLRLTSSPLLSTFVIWNQIKFPLSAAAGKYHYFTFQWQCLCHLNLRRKAQTSSGVFWLFCGAHLLSDDGDQISAQLLAGQSRFPRAKPGDGQCHPNPKLSGRCPIENPQSQICGRGQERLCLE